MPPTLVHLNGGINRPGPEEALREVGERVGKLCHALPDGETGDRNYWIVFQLGKLQAADGLVEVPPRESAVQGRKVEQLRVAEGVDPDDVDFGNLGYADAYLANYEIFKRLREEGAVPDGVRFQVQYPTPLAVIVGFIDPSDIDRLLLPYERALFADLQRVIDGVPHEDLQVQWDVCIEIGIMEDADWYELGPDRDRNVAPGVARAVDFVPEDVPVGLHLCYGDYKHSHWSEPESLRVQVDLLNGTVAESHRPVNFTSFTVPQYQDGESYFAPLADLSKYAVDRMYFGIVPYRPGDQAPGTTARQIEQIDRYLDEWGVCTECGMGRCERDDVRPLLELHRAILEGAQTTPA